MSSHIKDTGTVIELTIKSGKNAVDVSGATSKLILLGRPNGTFIQKPATFTTDGTDGKIRCTTTQDDFDMRGDWKAQGKVTLSSGSWYTDIVTFRVDTNIA